jgi:hypothetical protein
MRGWFDVMAKREAVDTTITAYRSPAQVNRPAREVFTLPRLTNFTLTLPPDKAAKLRAYQSATDAYAKLSPRHPEGWQAEISRQAYDQLLPLRKSD